MGLANQSVILCMGPNPKPDDAVRRIDSKRTIVKPDSGGPEPAHLLETQRWMLGIRFQQLKSTISLFADRSS